MSFSVTGVPRIGRAPGEEDDAMSRLDVFVEDGSDYHVKVDGTRLPILACARFHVNIYKNDYRVC